MKRIQYFVFAILLVAQSTLLSGTEKGQETPGKNQPQGTLHTVEARVGYPINAGAGIQAERQPGQFTIPKGFQGAKLKYSFSDPKFDYQSTKLRGSNIYSITEKRYMRELESDPDYVLPPGEYKFVVGGLPGAMGTLSYTTVPSSGTSLPPRPPGDPKGPPGHSSPPAGFPKPAGEEVLLNLPRDFDVRPTDVKSVPQGSWMGNHKEMIFRFRGSSVAVEHKFTIPVDNSDPKSQLHGTYRIQGEFVRGQLTGKGSLLYFARDVSQGIDLAENHLEAQISGHANADGRMVIQSTWELRRIQMRAGEGQGPNKPIRWGDWKDYTQEYRSKGWMKPIDTRFTLQLPIGQLQSTQTLVPDESSASPNKE